MFPLFPSSSVYHLNAHCDDIRSNRITLDYKKWIFTEGRACLSCFMLIRRRFCTITWPSSGGDGNDAMPSRASTENEEDNDCPMQCNQGKNTKTENRYQKVSPLQKRAMASAMEIIALETENAGIVPLSQSTKLLELECKKISVQTPYARAFQKFITDNSELLISTSCNRKGSFICTKQTIQNLLKEEAAP